jgi:arylsulfatase A-like enzyme
MNVPKTQPTRRLALSFALALVVAALVLACRPKPEPPRPVPAGAPRLVLFIIADQLRADYLVRFRPVLQHGLARLLDESVVFTEAHHDHAATVTATGHATLTTGTFPSSHGIVGNSWYSREEERTVAAVWDPDHGSSPRHLERPTIGDLMKQAWPESKVYGVSSKARSAILSAGRDADSAYWYDDRSGEIVTSTYFESEAAEESEGSGGRRPRDGDDVTVVADWRAAFHDRKLLDPLFGETWEPLLPFAEVERFGILPLDRGWFGTSFPYVIGGLTAEPNEGFYSDLGETPFVDSYLTDFAKALIDGEGLGADEVPDYLGIAYSQLDIVGHGFGPDAHETLDTLMRLDRTIGELLDFVDQRIGLDNVVIALSSDHGVVRVPELLLALGQDAGRFGVEQVTCVQRAGRDIARQYGIEGSGWMPALLYLDREALSARQVDPDRLLRDLGDRLAACPRIERVLHPSELSETSPDDIVAKFARSHYPGRSSDLLLHLQANTLATTSLAASHGTAHRYDTHVPWLLRVPGIAPRQIELPVRTADVAPTIADLLEIRDLPEARFDGASRLLLAREGPAPATVEATSSPSAGGGSP